MKKIHPAIFLAALLFSGVAWAAEYFVAPGGSDAQAGSLEQPFATVQRAQAAVEAGDTVNIRGGIYRLTEAQIARRKGIFAYVTHLDKSGAPGRRITYQAYQNERPVFDFSLVRPAGLRVDAFYVSASWIHIKGLEVTGVQVTSPGHSQSICFENDGSHNIYERLLMHDGQAIGIYSVRGSDNLFLNCDAWNNWDFTSGNGKGGNVDGFGCHPTKGATGNVFRGCRAWFNSDDGFDCINAREAVTLENCWAFYNGFSTKFVSLGDGSGFKIGGFGLTTAASKIPSPIPRHTIRFCLAVGNKSNGFYANHHPGGSDWLHNTASRNGNNFNMLGRNLGNHSDVDGFGHKLRNNLSFNGHPDMIRFHSGRCDSLNNWFDLDLKISDRDFVSLDEKELTTPRQPNGDLPVMGFLHPAVGSALLDKGADIGLPFRGSAPELGAFER